LAGAAVADASKLARAEVGYRDAPRGSARCDHCIQFRPPAACGIVDGPVSPAGSCNLFAPKPR
jgi:hypothetical protein